MKYRLVNHNYFIYTNKGFEKVGGIPIKHKQLDLFLHKVDGKISITEAKTGMRISALHAKKSVAMKFVEIIIEKHGIAEVNTRVETSIKTIGLSPRYRFIVNPSR